MILVTKTELVRKSSAVEDILLSGEDIIITSYGKAIGMLTPQIPEEVRAKLRVKKPGSFYFRKM